MLPSNSLLFPPHRSFSQYGLISQLHTRCQHMVVNKVSASMELVQIEKTSIIFVIIRGDSGPGWGGTALCKEAPPQALRCPLPPQERALTGRDDTNGHLFKIRHPPSQKGLRGFPDSKDTADSQLIINDAHEHASPFFL